MRFRRGFNRYIYQSGKLNTRLRNWPNTNRHKRHP